MAKTVDRRPEAGSSPKDVGRQLRHVRRKQGLSRSEVARSAGLTRRELAAYERGRVDIPESDLWCLAGSCGVDVGELLPHRDKLRVDSDLSSLAIGDTIRHLRSPGEPDGLLTEYLSMIYELRNLPPGTRVPLREEDLHTLADALGGSPDVIESRLGELIGANREEAARLRAMILPPLSLPAPGASDAGPGGDFFATPRAADPFAPPPPLAGQGLDAVLAPMDAMPPTQPVEPMDAVPMDAMPPMEPMEPMPPATPLLEPMAPAPPTAADPMEPVTPDPTDPLATLPVDPFALPEEPDPLAVLRADPFAPAGGAPPIAPRDVDPDAARDGIVVDFGEPVAGYGTEPDATEPMVAPHTVLDVPAAPLSEAPIDVAGLDAPADDILPDLDAPVAGAFADAFDTTPTDAAPFESVPFDRIPFGIETDVAEPAFGAAPIGDDLAPLTDEPPAIDAFLNTLVVTEPEPVEAEALEAQPLGAEPLGAETVELDAIEPEPETIEPEPETIEPEPVAVVPVDEPTAIAWHAPVVALETDAGAPTEHDGDTAGNGAAHFTKAGPGWQVGGMSPATAMADDGALALRRAEARWALCDVHQPGDFTAEAVVEFTTGTGFGILFRAMVDDHDRVSGYSFDVDPVAGGGGYLIRQWEANRPHWRPLAQAHVTDANMLYGRHTISLTMRGDQLTVHVDGETVVTIPSLSRLSVDLGREPARGDRLGVQAGTTTEVTVDRFAAASH